MTKPKRLELKGVSYVADQLVCRELQLVFSPGVSHVLKK